MLQCKIKTKKRYKVKNRSLFVRISSASSGQGLLTIHGGSGTGGFGLAKKYNDVVLSDNIS